MFAERMSAAAKRFPRNVGLEAHFAALLPEVTIPVTLDGFAALAAKAMMPRPEPEGVSLAHLHVARVSVREQAVIISDHLKRSGTTTFRALVADAESKIIVIGRFLALLELYRDALVAFEQVTPLGDLTIRWTGNEDAEVNVSDDYDDFADDVPEPASQLTIEDTTDTNEEPADE